MTVINIPRTDRSHPASGPRGNGNVIVRESTSGDTVVFDVGSLFYSNVTPAQATEIRDAFTAALEELDARRPHPDAEVRDSVSNIIYATSYDNLFGDYARSHVDKVIAAVRSVERA